MDNGLFGWVSAVIDLPNLGQNISLFTLKLVADLAVPHMTQGNAVLHESVRFLVCFHGTMCAFRLNQLSMNATFVKPPNCLTSLIFPDSLCNRAPEKLTGGGFCLWGVSLKKRLVCGSDGR